MQTLLLLCLLSYLCLIFCVAITVVTLIIRSNLYFQYKLQSSDLMFSLISLIRKTSAAVLNMSVIFPLFQTASKGNRHRLTPPKPNKSSPLAIGVSIYDFPM